MAVQYFASFMILKKNLWHLLFARQAFALQLSM